MRIWRWFVRWAIHPKFSEREAVRVLRSALMDACRECPICKGTNKIGLPGAWMKCAHCSLWRSALEATRRA